MRRVVETLEIARTPEDVYRFVIEEGIGQNRAPGLFEGSGGPVFSEVLGSGRLEVGARVREVVQIAAGKTDTVQRIKAAREAPVGKSAAVTDESGGDAPASRLRRMIF